MLAEVRVRRGVQVADHRGLSVTPRRFHGRSRFPALPDVDRYDEDSWVTLRWKHGVRVEAFVSQSGVVEIDARRGQTRLDFRRVFAHKEPSAVVFELPKETLWLRFDFTFSDEKIA